jgi:hypothetical protein
MSKELMNLFLFIGICFVLFMLFRVTIPFKEGMTTDSSSSSSSTNGIAGNAASYGATIKSNTIILQDSLLLTKYSEDYENAVLNLDDLINNLMLKTALSVDINNPEKAIKKLAEMNQAKLALNDVMKFVDSSK